MSESRLSIVGIASPQTTAGGDFVYRLKQPYEALGKIPGVATATVTNVISSRSRLLESASLLVIHLLGDQDIVPLVERRRRAGLPTVFEISDDFLHFQPDNPAASFYERPESKATILQLISMSDAIQTSTLPLAEMFSKYNSSVRVFINQMESIGTPDKRKGPVTIGWGGSAGHFQDILEISPFIVNLLLRKDNAKFALMSDKRFVELFKALPKDKFKWRPPGSLADFYDFNQTLDIGIAPIANVEFNLCRSDVKFMEYASRGAAPVCSDVPTYSRTLRNGETGFLFKTPEEMAEILEMLIDNRDMRRKIGGQAWEYIRDERREENAAAQKLEFYRELVKKSENARVSTSVKAPDFDTNPSLNKCGSANYYIHEMTEAEKFCFNGMLRWFGSADAKGAIKDYCAALKTEPDYYLARLCLALAESASDPLEALNDCGRALDAEPLGFNAATLKVSLLRKMEGSSESVLKAATDAAEKFPFMAEALTTLSELQARAGQDADAVANLEKAVAANPWSALSSTALGMHILEKGDPEAALRILTPAAEINPKHPQLRLAMGAAFKSLGKTNEALDEFLAAIALLPGEKYALVNLLEIAKSKYGSGDSQSAMDALDRAIAAGANDPDIFFWALRIAERSKNPSASVYREKLATADSEGRYSKYY